LNIVLKWVKSQIMFWKSVLKNFKVPHITNKESTPIFLDQFSWLWTNALLYIYTFTSTEELKDLGSIDNILTLFSNQRFLMSSQSVFCGSFTFYMIWGSFFIQMMMYGKSWTLVMLMIMIIITAPEISLTVSTTFVSDQWFSSPLSLSSQMATIASY
jgi:hypothetical protein